jgi:hypothetical protein
MRGLHNGGPAKKNLIEKLSSPRNVQGGCLMDVTGSILQLNTPDGKMEAYEARPKDSGS